MAKPGRPSYAKLAVQCQAARDALATCERYRRTELIELHNRRAEVAQLQGENIRLRAEVAHLLKPKSSRRGFGLL